MILVRAIFQAKYGKGGELVALMKEVSGAIPEYSPDRILTDLSGPFFTVVVEETMESMGAWEARNKTLFADPKFGPLFAKMETLVESGRREFFTIQ